MLDHTWCLGIRLCGDKMGCPLRQLNGGCIESAVNGESPDRPTLTAHSHGRAQSATYNGWWSRAVVIHACGCTYV